MQVRIVVGDHVKIRVAAGAGERRLQHQEGRPVAGVAGRDPQEIGIAPRQPMKIVSDPALSNGEWPLVDTVQNVIDNVGRFRDAGVGCLVMDTFGNPELYGETADSILTTMERFATEVIPRFPEP